MSKKSKRGKFITLEGMEGCGKSTQVRHIQSVLKKAKVPFIVVREPGGTIISEKIRELLLDKKHTEMTHESELLLYCAARAQIVKEVIEPALSAGKTVICDRFYDSTLAYQGYGLGMDLTLVEKMCQFAAQSVEPDLTFLLDVPVATGLKRAGRTDRIEARSKAYHERVRKGFLALAEKYTKRFVCISGTQTIDAVSNAVEKSVRDVIAR